MTKASKIAQAVTTAISCWLASTALSQQGVGLRPVTDGVQQPQGVYIIPWATPRSIDDPGAFHQGNQVTTPPLDLVAVLAEDATAGKGPERMGIIQEIEGVEQSAGQWTDLADGGRLYTLWIHATGARAIRLRISDWNPPADAELIIYSPDAPEYALGPVTRTWLMQPGELWTPTVYDDDVFLEYYLPASVDHTLPESQLVVDGLLNQYRALGDDGQGEGAELDCHRDVGCYAQWALAASGVGITSFIGGGALPGGFYCSAAMLTRVNGDFTPLLMTASHCRQAGTDAGNLEVTWTYQSPGCGGILPDPNTLPRGRGVAQLVNDVSTDWIILGLLSDNTGGVLFQGWDPNSWADNSTATGIHHPDRSYKRISFGTKLDNTGSRPEPVNQTTCISGTSFHIQYNVGNGLLEPGSSGSPIFDATQRVRGVASCANSSCTTDTDANYGRLDQVYPVAQAYLDPVDPVFVNGGYGGFERGTAGQPVNRFVEGVYAVGRTRNLFIQAGNYNERLTIDKAMTLNASGGTVTIGQ